MNEVKILVFLNQKIKNMIFFSNKYEKLVKLLKLDKPLVVFDISTTGPGISSDKIIQLAYTKIWPDGRTKQDDMFLNPEMKISAESIAIHGIRNKFVKDMPTFRDKSQEIWDIFSDSYYSGYNIMEYDLPVLRREFVRVGMDFEYDEKSIIDSRMIFYYMAPRTIPLAYEYYCDKEYKGMYNASVHTELAIDILIKQLEKYNVARNLDFLNMIHSTSDEERQGSTRKFYWLNGEAYFSFSKYKDQSIKSVIKKDKKFIDWLLEADFTEDTKSIIRQELGENGKDKKEETKLDKK